MNIIKRYTLTLAVAILPLFLFAQKSQFRYQLLPISKHTLQAKEKDKEAEFAENYSKGVEHYNKAIDILKAAGTEFVNLEEINALQDKTIAEFKIALPYFQNAYKLNPKDENTLMGLSGIYFSLNEIDKSDLYKKEYDAIHKE